MTRTWVTFTAKQKALAEKVFDALSTLDALGGEEPPGEGREYHIGFADLYDYAVNPECPGEDEIERAIGHDEKLREDFHRLLEKTSLCRFPHLAAASSGPVTTREWEGFRIHLRGSHAEPSQVYIQIDLLDPSSPPPKALFVIGGERQCRKHPLPEAQEKTIQILADAESDLVKALQDNKTEVFLR